MMCFGFSLYVCCLVTRVIHFNGLYRLYVKRRVMTWYGVGGGEKSKDFYVYIRCVVLWDMYETAVARSFPFLLRNFKNFFFLGGSIFGLLLD